MKARTISSFLVVDTRDAPAFPDGLEAGKKHVERYAREALGMSAERRELESRRAGLNHRVDMGGTVVWIDSRIEGEIHACLLACLSDFGLKPCGIGNQAAVVVWHIDDRGDAARGRAPRRPNEVFLTCLASAVDLGIDRTRQHDRSRAAVAFARGRGAGTYGANATFRDVDKNRSR